MEGLDSFRRSGYTNYKIVFVFFFLKSFSIYGKSRLLTLNAVYGRSRFIHYESPLCVRGGKSMGSGFGQETPVFRCQTQKEKQAGSQVQKLRL